MCSILVCVTLNIDSWIFYVHVYWQYLSSVLISYCHIDACLTLVSQRRCVTLHGDYSWKEAENKHIKGIKRDVFSANLHYVCFLICVFHASMQNIFNCVTLLCSCMWTSLLSSDKRFSVRNNPDTETTLILSLRYLFPLSFFGNLYIHFLIWWAVGS